MKFSRKSLSSIAALTACLAVTAASQAGLPEKPKGSSTWAGYIAKGPEFDKIVASWVQPTVQCTADYPNARVSIWVGLSGPGGILQQDGTVAVCEGAGAPKYYKTFWEFYSEAHQPGKEPFEVSPGDSIVASVTYDPSSDSDTLIVTDQTSGKVLNQVQACNGGCTRPEAEWIVERPGGGKYPLANFGGVRFFNAALGDNSGAVEIKKSSFDPDGDAPVKLRAMRMEFRDVVLAEPGKFEHKGLEPGFTVTWDAAQ